MPIWRSFLSRPVSGESARRIAAMNVAKMVVGDSGREFRCALTPDRKEVLFGFGRPNGAKPIAGHGRRSPARSHPRSRAPAPVRRRASKRLDRAFPEAWPVRHVAIELIGDAS